MSDIFKVKVIKSENTHGKYMSHWSENDLIGQIVEVKEVSTFYYKIVSGEYRDNYIFSNNCEIYNLDKIIENI